MTKRRTWTIITVVLAAVFAAGTVSIALGNPPAQPDPTQQQQTIDALIAERFTQTAAVQSAAGATQTAEAVTLFAPTLTAQFDATVNAAFEQALTATAASYVTATAQAEMSVRDQVIMWERQLADTVSQRLADTMAARLSELEDVTSAASETFRALAETAPGDAAFADRQAAAEALLVAAAEQHATFDAFFIYNAAGQVIAASDADRVGDDLAEHPFFTGSLAEARVNPVFHEGEDRVPVLLATQPILNAEGMVIGVVAGQMNLVPVDTIISQTAASTELPVAIYMVSAAESRLVAPLEYAGLSGYPELHSDGIDAGVAGQSGSGAYLNALDEPFEVIGLARYLEAFDAALLVEVPRADAEMVAANLPTVTPTPTLTASPAPGTPTPRPAIFPTDTVAEVAIAEQVFEHGRMFWIRHTRQIWIMVDDPDPAFPGGDWYCFNDTYEEGEPEIDPDIVPPEGMLQPRRGFGKLWRNHPDIREGLGWAITPEFELTSRYSYIAGGYVQDGQYIPGPGEHRLTTLNNESISFFEREIRGDCLGGMWRQTGQ